MMDIVEKLLADDICEIPGERYAVVREAAEEIMKLRIQLQLQLRKETK